MRRGRKEGKGNEEGGERRETEQEGVAGNGERGEEGRERGEGEEGKRCGANGQLKEMGNEMKREGK